MKLQVKRITNTSILPTKAYRGDAGWDLYADNETPIHIWKNTRVIIPTGIKMAIPDGYYGRIADRSSYAWKHGLHVLGGVIDSQYRGEIKVVMIGLCGANPTDMDKKTVMIERGNKIAQLIITKIHQGYLEEVDDISVDLSERREGGFGSSGK